ncbi:MAG: YbaB/EbfC family nucleoid-associated protein [Oscillospiraceae bacterium]|jgi:DNA-binding YbaB/EbfC family protein|nr:YbaB/EbfC family nucleoid-associated protein [Oscillospiraceae bacterium]
MKARLPKGVGGGGPTNMNQLALQAQKMQAEVERITAELEETEYTATVGGGTVNITMTGKLDITNLDIKPEVVDPEDVEMLSDLITSAVTEVIRKVNTDKESRLTAATGGMSLPGMF